MGGALLVADGQEADAGVEEVEGVHEGGAHDPRHHGAPSARSVSTIASLGVMRVMGSPFVLWNGLPS